MRSSNDRLPAERALVVSILHGKLHALAVKHVAPVAAKLNNLVVLLELLCTYDALLVTKYSGDSSL